MARSVYGLQLTYDICLSGTGFRIQVPTKYSRSGSVLEAVIRRLAQNCEPPPVTECHELVMDDFEVSEPGE
jgi:hypothetical protein